MSTQNTIKANEILSMPSPSITDFIAPKSKGSANDYYSDASYWWPDPKSPNGLPYIRRDGYLNPDNFCHHKDLLLQIVHGCETLYHAYRETGNTAYAAKIEDMLYTFFLDKEKRMNPYLLYSQAIPGICQGRSIGLIDTLQLIDLPFLIQHLRTEGIIPDSFHASISSWFSEYCDFLLESDFGKQEQSERNNHSIAIFLQIASFALLHRESGRIWQICKDKLVDDFIPNQIASDGSLPEELKRTKPYSYSIFAMDLLTTLTAILAKKYPTLWYYEDERGTGIRSAIDFITPYVRDKDKWPYGKDAEGFDSLPGKPSFLFFAAYAYRDDDYLLAYSNLRRKAHPSTTEDRNTPVKDPWLYI